MHAHRHLARRVALALLVVLALGAAPDAAVHPAAFSVVGTADAKAVDFEDGIVFFLVLGSDARDGQDVRQGNADAIELVALDFDTGNAAALAIPRDTWMDIPGKRFGRINESLSLGGPELVAESVEQLVGIRADYVLTSGFDGFVSMVDRVGPLTVYADAPVHPTGGRPVRRGLNRMDGEQALAFARERRQLARSDFDRIENQQSLMKAILRSLRQGEDQEGFMEGGSLAALRSLDTDLAPVELYRLAQAVTTFPLSRVTTCTVPGVPDRLPSGADVIRVDPAVAGAAGGDLEDARLGRDCG
ncbi:LCP family protein [Nocardioides guangzhouensis]|nr:LCP family protein [Nocardioides guangzhouensis]